MDIEQLTQSQSSYSWYFFFTTAGILLLLYGLLVILEQQVPQLPIQNKWKRRFLWFLRRFRLLHVPFSFLILGSTFFLIFPRLHGYVLLFVIIVCFPLLRNYIIGKLLCFDEDFHTGKRILANGVSGVISRITGLGIYVMSDTGMQYFNYKNLQESGYSLRSDQDNNEYCYLNLTPKGNEAKQLSSQALLYKLMSVPYLDNRYKPTPMDLIDDNSLQIRVMIRKGNHRKELVHLIEHWGFHCELTH